jgi:hypothetical protein
LKPQTNLQLLKSQSRGAVGHIVQGSSVVTNPNSTISEMTLDCKDRHPDYARSRCCRTYYGGHENDCTVKVTCVGMSSENTLAPSPVFGSESCDLHAAKCITSPHNGNVGSSNTINTSKMLRAGFPIEEWAPDRDRQVVRSRIAAPQRPREVLKNPNLTTTIENGKTIKPRWLPLSKSVEFIDSRGICGLANTQTGNSMKHLDGPCTAASAGSTVTATAAEVASADVKHSGCSIPDVASAGMFQNQVFFGE